MSDDLKALQIVFRAGIIMIALLAAAIVVSEIIAQVGGVPYCSCSHH